jgi:hypothetical protein
MIVNDIGQADAVIAIRTTYQSRPGKLKELNRPVPTVVVKSNTFSQIASALEEVITGSVGDQDRVNAAMAEAQQAIEHALQSGKPVELTPQDARTRKMQLQLIESKKLAAEGVGEDPKRRIRVLPVKLM